VRLARAALWLLLAVLAGAAPAAPGATVLVLGDSLSAGYGLARGEGWVELLAERLAARHPGVAVVNASISGETSAGGAERIEALLARHRPQVVVVELGGNDGLRGLALTATRTNLERIVAAAQGAGARVLLLGMRLPPNYGPRYSEGFARIYPEIAAARGAALVPFFLAGVGEDLAQMQPDGIHPRAAAQLRLLDNVWPYLEALL